MMPEIHVAVTRQVKPGLEDRFDELLRSFVHETMTTQGVTGVHILRPPTGSESREFGILRSFDDESSASSFTARRDSKHGPSKLRTWSRGNPCVDDSRDWKRSSAKQPVHSHQDGRWLSSHSSASFIGPVVVQRAAECAA